MTTPHRDLSDPSAARIFYTGRYDSGYMQDWPPEKVARVEALVRELSLPSSGTFLDFGCGSGVFTQALMRALPGWTAWGSDIVDNALQQARDRCPAARFVALADLSGRFDFVFSHHVLEHVPDLGETVSLLERLLAAGGRMFHILPCGNAGSFEHQICAARTDGLDPATGRFVFDEEGHLRRLTSDGLTKATAVHGFVPEQQHFANHYYGALKWMTEQTPAWLKMTLEPRMGRDQAATRWLSDARRRVLRLRYLRRPPSLLIPGMEWRLSKPHRSVLESAALIASNPMTIGSGLVDRWLSRAEAREWRDRRDDSRGSEMYLVYRKAAKGPVAPSR